MVKTYRDAVFGHRLGGMDVHYIVITDEALTKAMEIYTEWLDQKVADVSESQNIISAK